MRLPGRGRPAPLRIDAPRALATLLRDGPAPLDPRPVPDRLHAAFVVPWFFEGSGGHSTIANLVRGLEARGHDVSVWLEEGTAGDFGAFFGPGGRVMEGFDAWDGADVVVATGWQTVHRALLLPGCGARAYLVQDHEPEFYGTSAERTWAEQTYALGLHCVCASPWLADLVRERYGAAASSFDLGVRHDVYQPLALPRRDDLVVFYARAVTARRAVPLGVLALEELERRGSCLKPLLFGEPRPLATRFEQAGVLEPADLARLYNEATVGLVLSMTNPSLVPTEMLACGLPVVDIASDAMVATFGREGPVTLADFDPIAIADALEAGGRGGGEAFVAQRTWENAAAQVEAGLRAAFS
ncbi:MAG TPA: glycosyltransferase family 4 protein [Solirubrobacteraceae bacterium]|jgi:glycosyltransferase involved in cell wall biosynthesis